MCWITVLIPFSGYLGEENTFIDHHEEGLFELINDEGKYPQLNCLWDNFYDDPLITPTVAIPMLLQSARFRVLEPFQF